MQTSELVADGGHSLNTQRALAFARALMAVFALLAIFVDPPDPSRYAGWTRGLLLGYASYSAVFVLPSLIGVAMPSMLWLVLHAIDICFAGLITLLTGGPNSPFFAFLVLNLLTAAYIWGLFATLLTAGVGMVMLFSQALLLGSKAIAADLVEGDYDLNRAIMRTTYLTIIGALVGVLGEYQQQFQREQRILAQLLARPLMPRSNRGNMQLILKRVAQALDASAVTCVVEAVATGLLLKWSAESSPGRPGLRVTLTRLPSSDRDNFLFSPLGCSWYVNNGRWWRRAHAAALTAEGHAERELLAIPQLAVMRHSADSMLCVSVPISDDWTCRVFISNPRVRLESQRLLEFAHRAAREVARETYNTYLLLQLRARAEADERARLARDLHDGLTQSLIGAEIQLDVLRRQAEVQMPELGRDLHRVREILRGEILNLRELVRQTHANQLRPSDLHFYLLDLVERFQRDTGIAARFMTNLNPSELQLPSSTCRELAQIAREGLSNIRKHSGAQQALVTLSTIDGRVSLIIDDNGRGFPFSGKLDHADLDRLRKGPLVIKERVRIIGGELTVESTPALGSRLQITLSA